MADVRIAGWHVAIVLGCVALAAVATIVVTLGWRVDAPTYTAVAYLGINPMKKGASLVGQPEYAEVDLADLKATHAEMIKRDSVLIRALESPEVKKTHWYQRDREGSLGRLGDVLTVTPAPEANLISISITAAAPRVQDRIDLAEIANAVAEAYVEDVRKAATGARAEHIKRLRDKLADLHEMSDAIQSEIKRKRLPEVEFTLQQMTAQGVRLQALAAKGTELQLGKIQVEASLKDLEEHAKAGTLSKIAEVLAMVEKQPNIRALREREQDLHSKRVGLLEEVGPEDSSVAAIDASLAAVHKQIAPAIKEAAPVQAEAIKEQLLAKLESVTRQLLSVKEQKARIHDTVLVDLQRILIDMRDLQAREQGITENVRRIRDTLLELELLAEADRPVWLRAKATRPRTITSPK